MCFKICSFCGYYSLMMLEMGISSNVELKPNGSVERWVNVPQSNLLHRKSRRLPGSPCWGSSR
jgi:hypothetical protein